MVTAAPAAEDTPLRWLSAIQETGSPSNHNPPGSGHVCIRSEDFQVRRFAQRTPSCLIFSLDASGSAAQQRLAEAKGAVEILLHDAYARRDSVCVIAFRMAHAQLLLAPTRSLVRAKRALAGSISPTTNTAIKSGRYQSA